MGDDKKINSVMKESLVEKANEVRIFDNIDKNAVYSSFKKYGFDKSVMDRIFFAEVYNSSEQQELNQVFRIISKTEGASLIDIVLFLEQDYDKLKKILAFLDGDSKALLKNQMSKRYGFKIEENKLWKILR